MLLPSPALPPSVRELRVWQRFHVRITALYGAALLAVFIVLGVLRYFAGVDAELRGLQSRLRAQVARRTADLTPAAGDEIQSHFERFTRY